MRSKIFILLALVMAAVLPMRADVLAAADSAYSKKNYPEAIRLYEEARNASGQSAQLLYNLGNAYYQDQQPANAMICFERALKLDPDNKKIKNNIEFIRQQVADRNLADLGGKMKRVDYGDATFTDTFYNWVAKGTASDTWAWLAAIAFVLAMGCAAVYLFVKVVAARKMGFFIGLIFLGFSGLFLLFSFWSEGYYRSHNYAVLTIFKTELYSEPKSNAEAATTPLNAGTKVEILKALPEGSDKPEWYKVKLNQDFTGWVEAKDLEII